MDSIYKSSIYNGDKCINMPTDYNGGRNIPNIFPYELKSQTENTSSSRCYRQAHSNQYANTYQYYNTSMNVHSQQNSSPVIDTNLQLLQQCEPEKSVKYSPFDYYNYHYHVCSTNNHVVYKMIYYEMKEGYFRPFFLLCTSTIKLITSSVNSTSLS